MHRQWVTMRGGYVVTADDARSIASLPWLMGSRPICSGADLVKHLRASMAHGRCQRCAEQGIDGPAEVCAECAHAMSVKEAERRLSAARALRAQANERRHWEDGESDLRMKLGRAKRATSTSA
jgi:ribosomal protein L37E